jgi:RimJ/RimL family protein N-acetyltransferase
MTNTTYETSRLIIRPWNIDDFEDLHTLGNSADVMKYLDKSQYTLEETMHVMNDYQDHMVLHGFGPMACIEKKSNVLIGAAALRYLKGVPHLINKVEIGWRISANYWGKGYAGEISQKLFEISFLELNFDEVVAIVSEHNNKSIRALEKLGMTTILKNNFIHPARRFELNPYKLYTLTKDEYLTKITE